MAKGITLNDGRMINADYIALVSALAHDGESSGFTIEFSNGSKIYISGSKAEVVKNYIDVRRAIGIPDPDLIR
ncbi:hypothetical protein ACULML_17815 [Xanthomonas arboricola pv. corylina]|uniref:hypothetical protein n=1 Tax=Xanthomonas arboricola TaxID=56448 RepID=UPI004040A3D0